jgi:hypothetical protein
MPWLSFTGRTNLLNFLPSDCLVFRTFFSSYSGHLYDCSFQSRCTSLCGVPNVLSNHCCIQRTSFAIFRTFLRSLCTSLCGGLGPAAMVDPCFLAVFSIP